MRASFLARVLGILRTRIPGAVLFPAVLAVCYAASRGLFHPSRALLIALALVAAEFADLIASDVARLRMGSGEAVAHVLPGSPVIPGLAHSAGWQLLIVSLLLAFCALVLGLFVAWTGPRVLVLFGAAAACALLYALEPFEGSFIATAAVPSLITGGFYAVLSGGWDGRAFLAGVPVCLASAGVILTYRLAYPQGRQARTGRFLVRASHAAALASVFGLVAAGTYRWPVLAAIIPAAALAALAWLMIRKHKEDPVPATAAGVLMHSVLCLSLGGLLLL